MPDPVKPKVLAPGVNDDTATSGSNPRSNTKKDRTLPTKSDKTKVEDHSRNNKSSVKQKNRVDSNISYKHTIINSNSNYVCKICNKCLMSFNHDKCVVKSLKFVKKPLVNKVVQIVLWYLDSGCSKHMTGDRSRLRNFVKSFIRTVRFRNDHFGAIMGYGDYVIGDIAFRKHSCYVRDVNSVDLIKGNHGTNLYTISIKDMMKSSPICLLSKASKNKSWLWHYRLNQLNFDTINDLARKDLVRVLPRLKFEKVYLCSACQLGKSQKYSYKPKYENTNLEVLNTLHMELCGPMRVKTINGKKYILVIIDDYSSVGIFHQKSVSKTPQQNGVVKRRNRTLVEAARTMLIFSKAPIVERPVPHALAVQVPVVSAGTPSSITIDQDAPSTSYSHSSSVVQPPISHQGVVAGPTIKDNPFAQAGNDPFINVFAPEPSSDESLSRDVSSAKSTQVVHPHNHLGIWSKDHPLDNVIGNPSRLVSTIKQLATDALWCLYNFVLSKVEPKNVKTAMDEACSFEAMQEEIHEFDRLQVCELVLKPDCIMIIALKWIYKVKLDEYGDVSKNKA
ncbi:retrovirus-related pol polyprotein from transposon TNT 1-94 [Tanacetum coccineum]